MKYEPGKHYDLSSGEHYDESAPQKVIAYCTICGQKREGIYRGSNAAAHTYFCEKGFEYDEESERIIKYHTFSVETEENKKKKITAQNKERLKDAAGGALVGVGAAKILSDTASEEVANEASKIATEEAGKSFLTILKEEAITAVKNPIEWLFGDGLS